MALILNIETATKTCSVNLAKKGLVLVKKEITSEKYIHGEKLHVLINQLFQSSKIPITNLDAVAVSSGPGSFTGLRIGVSAAKGIAFALNIPLISMDALDIMIQQYKLQATEKKNIYFPMIDARREEVYTKGYNVKKQPITEIGCPEINELFLNKYDNYDEIYFLGSGASKFKNKFSNQKPIIHDHILNSSLGMVTVTYQKFNNAEFEDLSYFNPFYLKDFKIDVKK